MDKVSVMQSFDGFHIVRKIGNTVEHAESTGQSMGILAH